MPSTVPPTLILCDGSVGSLVACAAAGQSGAAPSAAGAVALWEAGDEGARAHAAERQCELLGLDCHALPIVLPAGNLGLGGRQSVMLVQAAHAAAEAGFVKVLWPVHARGTGEPDLDRVSAIVDRALLASRLVALDAPEHGCPAFRIETPYADFTDDQMAELVLDLDAPVQTCWWWGGEGAAAASERQRWMAALEACGWAPA